MAKRFDDDEWDDFEEYEEEVEPGILTTSRILVAYSWRLPDSCSQSR